MPYGTTLTGFVGFLASVAVFAGQEFTQGFGTPEAASIRDDRWALLSLDVLPVALVAAALAVGFTGWGAWGMAVVHAPLFSERRGDHQAAGGSWPG
jgi:hypothetical protein